MGQTGFAKVNLVVDHTRQQMQAGAVDGPIDRDVITTIDIHDGGIFDQHVAAAHVVGQTTWADLNSVRDMSVSWVGQNCHGESCRMDPASGILV